MRFTVGKSSIQREINFLQAVAEKKSTIPVLQNILFEAGHGGVTLRATDLDTTLTTFVDAQVTEEGSTCIPARKFFDIVKALPDAEITIESVTDKNSEAVKIVCLKSKFKLATLSPDDFPSAPSLTSEMAEVPAEMLSTMIARTIFASTIEESRYAINAVKIDITAARAQMVATDGHRLAYVARETPFAGQPIDALVPRKSLELVAKLIETTGVVGVAVEKNLIFFELGKRRIASRLSAGQFPQYQLILDKKGSTNTITINSPELSGALRRVSLMADTRSHAVKMGLASTVMHLTASSAENGEAGEDLAIEYTGPEMMVGFQSAYILEYFSAVDKPQVKVEISQANEPIFMSPVDDGAYDYRYVVMPMRI